MNTVCTHKRNFYCS